MENHPKGLLETAQKGCFRPGRSFLVFSELGKFSNFEGPKLLPNGKVVVEWREPNGTYVEPQRASVRAGRLVITRESGPHASALRLKISKMSAIERSIAPFA